MNFFNRYLTSWPRNLFDLGWLGFQCSLFFLASSAFLSALFLIIAIFCGVAKNPNKFWKDLWNYPLILISFLMLIGSLNAYSGRLAWLGLANWIPFFLIYWACQPYLFTYESRKRSALLILAGTVPVVSLGIGQLFFGWQGPWQIFNGLIIWFIDPGGNPIGRLSGLFNYANIAGAWLSSVWPFALAALFQPFLKRLDKTIYFCFALLIVFSLILTDSRNAWGGLILSIPFVLGSSSWFWLLPLLLILILPVIFAVLPGLPLNLQNFSRLIVPEVIWGRLNDMNLITPRPLEITRLNQWKEAVNFIGQRPLWGWGAAAFSIIYTLKTGFWHGHSHNLPVEVALSHGIPVAMLLVTFVLLLLMNSFSKTVMVFRQNNHIVPSTLLFDRAWWASSLTLVFLHAFDIPMFDSRLNLLGWILLAGLRSIILNGKPQQITSEETVLDA